MAKAEGPWTWWNQYGSVSLDKCVRRAKDAGTGVIIKAGWGVPRRAFIAAGVPWATEAYCYPRTAEAQAELLAAEIRNGAQFAVINAEVEWESLPQLAMDRLIARFRSIHPRAELYASVDTRGGRTTLPYQRVLAQHVTGWMPMIYPKAFQRTVLSSFAVSLDGKDFRGKPVLPTIQTYDNIGAGQVTEQVNETNRRGLPGCQAYTVCHATDQEWSAFVEAIKEEDMEDTVLRQRLTVAGLFERAASYAKLGEQLPSALRAQLRYLLG